MNAVESLSQSGDFQLLVAEVGDELQGSSERGGEAVQYFWVDTSPLSIWETPATEAPTGWRLAPG
jgi:hypothetical protein